MKLDMLGCRRSFSVALRSCVASCPPKPKARSSGELSYDGEGRAGLRIAHWGLRDEFTEVGRAGLFRAVRERNGGKRAFLLRKQAFSGGRLPVVCGEPMLVWGKPEMVCGKSVVVCGKPVLVRGKAEMVCGKPLLVCGEPMLVCGKPEMVRGKPVVVCGEPMLVCGKPELVRGKPVLVCGKPVLVCGTSGLVCGKLPRVRGIRCGFPGGTRRSSRIGETFRQQTHSNQKQPNNH